MSGRDRQATLAQRTVEAAAGRVEPERPQRRSPPGAAARPLPLLVVIVLSAVRLGRCISWRDSSDTGSLFLLVTPMAITTLFVVANLALGAGLAAWFLVTTSPPVTR